MNGRNEQTKEEGRKEERNEPTKEEGRKGVREERTNEQKKGARAEGQKEGTKQE
jgi:hypothetical protein